MAAPNRGRRSLSSKIIKPAKGLLDAEASDHEDDQELASPEMLAKFALVNLDAAAGELEKEEIPPANGALAPSLDVPPIAGAVVGIVTGPILGAPNPSPSSFSEVRLRIQTADRKFFIFPPCSACSKVSQYQPNPKIDRLNGWPSEERRNYGV
jgi:hypothetical protein